MQHKTSYSTLIAVVFYVLMNTISYSQNETCVSTAKRVYKNLVNSIGNNFPSPPRLIFSDKERFVAAVSNGEILIEKKALSSLCSFTDSESAIAYVLSHELAHYYLNHSWMNNTGMSYASSLGQFLNDKSADLDQRKIAESQADLFGGFFSQISGYNALYIAPEVLNNLYTEYNLPHEMKGYPSLVERKSIIDANLEEVRKLNLIFEAGNLNILKGDYELATKCYTHILNKKFTSREIYNNLGAVYLNIAINNFEENISKFIYPIFYENNSRAGNNVTRGGNDFLINHKEQLDLAIDMFNRSILLDDNFVPAKTNLILGEMIKNKVEGISWEDTVLKKLGEIDNLKKDVYFDIIILSNLLFSNKKQKIKKLLKNASPISNYNFEKSFNAEKFINLENKIKPENYSQINIDNLQLSGFKNPYEFASTGKGIKIKKKIINNDVVYEIIGSNDYNYFIEINNEEYFTSKGLKLNDNVSYIMEKYSIPDEIHKIGEHLYYIYRNQKIIFCTFKNKISKIIIYS